MRTSSSAGHINQILEQWEPIYPKSVWGIGRGKLETEVEDKGRITIPAQIRRNLGISKGDKLDITTKDGALILKRKKIVTVSDIEGVIGRHRVKLADIDNAIGREEDAGL